jgi:hypothetical protein
MCLLGGHCEFARGDRGRRSADPGELLPTIPVPTLVVHAMDDNVVPFPSGEYLARNIPGARFLPIDFPAHLSVRRTSGAIVDWVEDFEEFVTGVRPISFTDRVLSTVLYTDSSTPPCEPRRSVTLNGNSFSIATTDSSDGRSAATMASW